MPLPVVSGRAVVKVLQRTGWTASRRKGSHIILTKPAAFNTLSVPDHNELDPGTLRSLIRKAGLSLDEFMSLLE